MSFRPEFSWEFLSKEEIESRSIKAFRNHLFHIKEVSPYYKKLLANISPDDIKTRADIATLPMTDKTTLVENLSEFRGVPPEEITETVITSGSTGKPLVFTMTSGDLNRLAFNEALSFNAAGVTPEDRVQILVSLDRLFIAGMAYYRGLTSLGANCTRVGVLPFKMQKEYFELLKPTILVGVPSFIAKFGQQLLDSGVDLKEAAVSKIICIGESIRTEDMLKSAVAEKIESIFGAKVFSTYGVTELALAYSECEFQNGNHSHPELVYTEIVDSDGNPVEDGEIGELVATPFGVEGVPLLRYKTGDITFKIKGECECGRKSTRIGPILSRSSQMIKLKGTTVYPLTITNALDELLSVEDYILEIEGDQISGDSVTLHIATKPTEVFDISEHLRAKARVTITILVTNTATLNSMRGDSRKKIKIIDKRNL